MSRFRKLSQTIWHCHYHILWTPKYRYRVIAGEIADQVNTCIRAFSEHLNREITEGSQRPRPSSGDGSSESSPFGLCWNDKRQNSNMSTEQIPPPQRKTLLG